MTTEQRTEHLRVGDTWRVLFYGYRPFQDQKRTVKIVAKFEKTVEVSELDGTWHHLSSWDDIKFLKRVSK